MKGKSGQAVIFIITSAVLVLLLILVFILQTMSNPLDVRIQIKELDTSDMAYYMENCVERELMEGIPGVLVTSGIYGGNVNNAIIHNNKTISYFLIDDKNEVINLSRIEEEIKVLVLDSFDYCEEEYFLSQQFSKNEIKWLDVEVSISEFESNVNVVFSVQSRLGSKEKQEEYAMSYSISERIYDLILVADEIVEYDLDNEYEHSLLDLFEIAEGHNFSLNIFNEDNNTIIYSLYEENPYYEFNFATKYKSYSCSNIPVDNEVLMDSMIDRCIG